MDRSNPYIYRIGSPTNSIGRPPKFYRSAELLPKGQSFGSVYAVSVEDAHFIEEAGTAAGYKGVVWSQRLWVDFDSEDGARAAQSKLKELGYDHVVYTTGGRGCHIGILRPSAPSHVLPLRDKQWVANNLPGADLSLYWHLHLIRLPGAVHERTGLAKRVLYKVEGRELILPPYDPDANVRAFREVSAEAGREGSIFQNWEIISQLTALNPNGSRHQHLVNISATLCNSSGINRDRALWIVQEVNRGFPEPKTEEEVEKIVDWAYSL